jgi:Helix-turn-helix domain
VSIQAIAWVLEHSDAEGIDRLVLLALANHAHSETGECHPGMRRIAHEAHCHPETVAAAVKRLVALGEVTIRERGKGRATTKYHLPWLSTGVVSARLYPRTSRPVVRGSNAVVRGSEPVVRGPGPRESRTINRTASDAAETSGVGAARPTRDVADLVAEERAWREEQQARVRAAHDELRERRA